MRSGRGLKACVVMAVLAMTTGAAGASPQGPFAGDIHSASVVLKLGKSGGAERQIDLFAERADSPTGTTSYVRISLRSCRKGICSGDSYAKLLQPEEFAVDDQGTSGLLDTTFAGLPLVVAWSEPCEGASVCIRGSGVIFSGGGSVTWRRESKVGVEATILGLDCKARGRVARETTATTTGPAAPPPENDPARPPAFMQADGAAC